MTIPNPKDTANEASFRLWAFHAAYAAGHDDKNPSRRFFKAIALSAQPASKPVLAGWKQAVAAIWRLNRQREFDSPLKRRCVAYWELVYAAIHEHTGIKITLRAWEVDQLTEIETEEKEPRP